VAEGDRRTLLGGAAIGLVTGLIGQTARAAGSYDPGANDNEIRIGQFGPLSGPVSSFGVLAYAMNAYFRMVNEQAGINGRKIVFINYDDGYSPPKSVEAARRLVESDEVPFIAGAMGTPGNIAVQKYMNAGAFCAAGSRQPALGRRAGHERIYGLSGSLRAQRES
jgi:branched-chain amino acid transport system substrate-binding protein